MLKCGRLVSLMVFLSVLILSGCNMHRNRTILKTPMPTPMPPAEILYLPAEVQIACDEDPDYRSGVSLWELPGLEPVDPDSSSGSNRGKYLGVVKDCAEVKIVDYAWSETDQAFYVYVKASPDQEYFDIEREKLEGWLELRFVNFAP